MAQQTINTGAAPNDGTGDVLRDAFTKTNGNFSELYAAVAAIGPIGTAAAKNTGTSGDAVPLLNGVSIVWSNAPAFGTGGTGAAKPELTINGGSGANGGPLIRYQKNSVTIGYVGSESGLNGGTGNDLACYATSNLLLHAGVGSFVKSDNSIVPSADNTLYLGKNDDDTPLAWKGLILKDQSNGKAYRIEMIGGVLTATDLTD